MYEGGDSSVPQFIIFQSSFPPSSAISLLKAEKYYSSQELIPLLRHLPKYLLPIYLLSILLLVTLPLNEANRILSDNYIVEIRLDYLAHVVLYLSYILLFTIALKNRKILAIISGMFFALSTEYLQYFLAYRTFNVNDLLANEIGVVVGSVVCLPGVYVRLEGWRRGLE